MKKLLKLVLCALMCSAVIFSCTAMSYAAAVGKVNKVTVSKVSAVSVTLKWSKVSGVTGYRVYRYNSSKKKYVSVGKTKKLKFTDDSLTGGKTYKYKVRAYKTKNGKTTYGAYSSVVKAVTNPRQAKKLKTSSVTSDSITLTWSKAKGAKEYEVYMYDSSKKKYISEGVTKSTGFTVKHLRPGTKYKFRVAAYHTKTGEKQYGKKSAYLSVITALDTVTDVVVDNITSNSYTLVWNPIPGATEYHIRQYSPEYKEWIDIKTVKTNNYTVSGLSYNQSAKYQIRAANSVSEGEYSDTVVASTLIVAPEDLKATTDTKTVTLTWSPVNVCTGYEIERFNSADGTWSKAGTSVNPTFTDITLNKAGVYIYRVRGYYSTGSRTYYSEYSATTDIYFESTVVNGSIYNEQLTNSGVAGYLYDPAEKCFYTSSDPWQRVAGYNEIYDTLAPITMISFDTVRLKFDYNNKNWMIQVWKGQYGMAFYGAEIGVYNKPMDRALEHYDCASDEDRLMMSMDFYEYENRLFGSDGWEKKFSRPYDSYWWCTGFVPGNKLGNFGSLRVDARITAKDYDMLIGIKNALAENSIQCTISGLNIYFTYN